MKEKLDFKNKDFFLKRNIFNKNQRFGMVLVSIVMLSSIIIIIIGVILFKVVNTTKDVVNIQKNDVSKNIADEGLEHVVDWMNNRNSPKNYPLGENDAADMLKDMNPTDFLKPINTLSGISSMISSFVLEEGETPYNRKNNNKDTFPPILGANVIYVSPNGSSNPIIPELNDSSVNVFTFRSISNNENKIKGDFQLGVVPVVVSPENPKYDLLKIISVSSIPSISSSNKKTRKFEAIVQRPKDVKVTLDHAILSQGSINLGNGIADASLTTNITLITKQGDVHTNGNLTIGPGGYVDGNASADGTVNVSNGGVVTGTITSNAPEKPIPELEYSNPFPSAPCVNSGTPNDIIFNGPCTYTGNFDIAGNSTLTITNKVYISGNYKESGNSKIISGSPYSMLVALGDLDTAGNASQDSNNKMAFVSVKGDISVVGNGDIKGLFFNDNSTGNVTVTGNGSVFGGIISHGTVSFSGQNATVIRDLSMVNVPFRIPADAYSIRLVSWKELK